MRQKRSVLEYLEDICRALKLPEDRKKAMVELYEQLSKNVHSKKFVAVSRRDAVASSIAYTSLRLAGYPIAISDVCNAIGAGVRLVTKINRKIKKATGISVKPARVEDFLKKYSQMLNCDRKLINKALKYAKYIRKKGKGSILYSKYTTLAILCLTSLNLGYVGTKKEFVSQLISSKSLSNTEIPNINYRIRQVQMCCDGAKI